MTKHNIPSMRWADVPNGSLVKRDIGGGIVGVKIKGNELLRFTSHSSGPVPQTLHTQTDDKRWLVLSTDPRALLNGVVHDINN